MLGERTPVVRPSGRPETTLLALPVTALGVSPVQVIPASDIRLFEVRPDVKPMARAPARAAVPAVGRQRMGKQTRRRAHLATPSSAVTPSALALLVPVSGVEGTRSRPGPEPDGSFQVASLTVLVRNTWPVPLLHTQVGRVT